MMELHPLLPRRKQLSKVRQTQRVESSIKESMKSALPMLPIQPVIGIILFWILSWEQEIFMTV
jgi:hypothetical protein